MIIKISPDIERAKSLFKMAIDSEKSRNKLFKVFENEVNQTILSQNYYESLRQLILSLMFIDGKKTVGENAHKETIDYLTNYEGFSNQDIFILQDLRIRRNQGMYEGKFIIRPYLENNKEKLDNIFNKLSNLIKEKLFKAQDNST